ncbi:class I SAM-dependent methyltransferase [Oceanirhabdus sp. W0125-5]|uniref:class I SAM-dependent methyltransferase n=1 Tax=Oceanirhabdus sp. W0125-5 TaxID=2999116 RepID=UPI0022F335E6|nr:class I SAM-dependent methyltransferase [Oceanirhabdus sp. W0125-5]WBW96905.1 class I SAM-dependent methyltransferase [Oceanirhabdus sp. W0125-5]
MSIYNKDFTNKTILEIGTGRGRTTKILADILKNYKGAKLISTDIYGGNFKRVNEELKDTGVEMEFIETGAVELNGIEEKSVDFIVCNYTLCAINSEVGQGILALDKFRKVLKQGGVIHIEEEFPIYDISNQRQEIWAEKWKILREIEMYKGSKLYKEYNHEILKQILHILGFEQIEVKCDAHLFQGQDCLEFFNIRVDKYLDGIENKHFINYIEEQRKKLTTKAVKVGGMEVPSYTLEAIKR